MKKKVFMMMSLVLSTGWFSACSSDEVESTGVKLRDSVPKYEDGCWWPAEDDMVTTAKGGWRITRYADMITEVEFDSLPPVSSEAFFGEYLPITNDNQLCLINWVKDDYTNRLLYRQFYKGVEVYNCEFVCSLDENDQLISVKGTFVPISDMSVTPALSEKDAVAKCVEYSGYEMAPALFAAAFYRDGKIYPHLIYLCEFWSGCFSVKRIIIDAHTGELLYKGEMN